MKLQLIVVVNMFLLLAAETCFSQTWLQVGTGIGNCYHGQWVEDIYVSQDNGKLLIAGSIVENGNCETMRTVLTWDGQQFYQTAEGPLGAYRSDLVFQYSGSTYAHGQFILGDEYRLNRLSQEGDWDVVPSGVSGLLQDCYVHDGIAYISGGLDYCDDVPCSFVCAFDGEQALPYYTGPAINYHIYSVNVYQDTVFAAGNYSAPAGLHTQGYSNCAKVVDGQLEKVGQGFPNSGVFYDMEQYDGKLFIGGSSPANGITGSHRIYYYEDGQLNTLPVEPNYTVNAMKAYNGGLYVAGDFTQIGDEPCVGVARWNGQQWTCLNHESIQFTWNSIKDIEVWNDTLYIGGGFHHIGNSEIKRIAKLDMALSEEFPVNITEQQSQELKLSVYPNPANDKINIQLSNPADVIIYTATGQLVETYSSKSNYQIDVSDYPTGLYLVVSGGVMKRFVRE